jgi:cytochrome c biogenesis protein CcdA
MLINVRAFSKDQIMVEYFHKPTCKECGQYQNSEGFDALINRLKNEYAEKVYIDWLDVNHKEIMDRLIEYNISITPAVVFNKKYRLVRGEITIERLREVMDNLLDNDNMTDFDGGISTLSASMIIVAGLVDGINPCAISLLVFFLSFLTGLERVNAKILKLGIAYITGNYLMYFALGLGIINTISILGIEHPIGKIGTIFLFAFGLINIRDALTFEAPLLKFPKFTTPIIKELTSKGALPAAILLGGFVSLFEFACSGGVYIGILVLLSNRARFWEGLSYLVIYNFFFILPLIIILVLGMKTQNLEIINQWRVRKRKRLKLVSGIFMMLLALFTYYWAFL